MTRWTARSYQAAQLGGWRMGEGMRTQRRLDCYLCGSAGETIYKGLTDRFGITRGTWGFLRCTSPICGLVWLDPTPIEADIGMAYDGYYTHTPARVADGSGLGSRTGLAQIAGMVLRRTRVYRPIADEHDRRLREYLDDIKPGRLLEVGCGNGSRLQKMRDLGWDVVGQDVDPEAVAVARKSGLTVHLGPVATAAFRSESFNAILMAHVIEHVHDPIALLQECRRVLHRGGRLVVFTPNFESYGHRRFRESWLGLDPPRHLHLFTVTTLLATSIPAGLDPVGLWTTEANAFSVCSGSANQKRSDRNRIGSEPELLGTLLARGFQYWASVEFIADPNSGEECVLVAAPSMR